MQQSNFIFGILVVAYIVFITVKGELGTYLGLLKGAGTPAPTNQSTSAAPSGILSTVQKMLQGQNSSATNNLLSQPSGLGNLLNQSTGTYFNTTDAVPAGQDVFTQAGF